MKLSLPWAENGHLYTNMALRNLGNYILWSFIEVLLFIVA